MADNTNKVTIGAEPITIPAAQFARILAAAVHCEYLMKQKHLNEEKLHRMRAELTRYQTICENRKRTSGAGASVEPQKTTTNAPGTETDAGVLTIRTEGRVSGGERAELESLRKERDELKAKLSTAQNYEAVIAAKDREIEGVKEERNRLNAKVNELIKKLEDFNEEGQMEASARTDRRIGGDGGYGRTAVSRQVGLSRLPVVGTRADEDSETT